MSTYNLLCWNNVVKLVVVVAAANVTTEELALLLIAATGLTPLDDVSDCIERIRRHTGYTRCQNTTTYHHSCSLIVHNVRMLLRYNQIHSHSADGFRQTLLHYIRLMT